MWEEQGIRIGRKGQQVQLSACFQRVVLLREEAASCSESQLSPCKALRQSSAPWLQLEAFSPMSLY